ncbi:glycerate kinase [Saccharibacillus alkalitolerans]|uniref:Glycerate kinase n=1 Tax=Saccharibacillus alkalitolerans TaxID=2705290 RepID=A0ABX0F932_9BACL|nr:glycerate kinase [Saccharibacillus alkalitolerans]NGZ76425.1 glycerate kinase [Saccharibacillus alkalitolerans]
MKFVLAPDSFKESMTAKEAAEAMRSGIKQVFPDAECVMAPMADGGEGTVESLVDYTGGRMIRLRVTGPLGTPVDAEYGLSGDGQTAIIEMASASGIHLVKPQDRDPLLTTTYGTGELIRDALDRGARHVLMGIGGSVTNDGGAGMLQALGVSLTDEEGRELSFGGGALNRLRRIDVSGLDVRLRDTRVEVACDVTNPLTGTNGASRVFGPQKGASPEMVEELDRGLSRYADVIFEQTGRDVSKAAGAGAAGGLGAGLLAFLDAELKRGVELVIEYTALKEQMKGADYVFTGEGSIDRQTRFGKTPYGVADAARELGIPVIAFAGRIGEGAEELYDCGFTAVIGILREAGSLEQALQEGRANLAFAAQNICRAIRQASET